MLFTGAGFSAEARDRAGAPLPDSAQMACDLWQLLFPDERPDDSDPRGPLRHRVAARARQAARVRRYPPADRRRAAAGLVRDVVLGAVAADLHAERRRPRGRGRAPVRSARARSSRSRRSPKPPPPIPGALEVDPPQRDRRRRRVAGHVLDDAICPTARAPRPRLRAAGRGSRHGAVRVRRDPARRDGALAARRARGPSGNRRRPTARTRS